MAWSNTMCGESCFNCSLFRCQAIGWGAGAYIGLLQQLGTILQPADPWQPKPGMPDPPASAPAEEWRDPRAIVQWQNSCFIDLTGGWPPYKRLLSGKYAIRVMHPEWAGKLSESRPILVC